MAEEPREPTKEEDFTPETEEVEPRCPPGQDWNPVTKQCEGPEDKPPPEPPLPEPEPVELPPCPFEGALYPFSLITTPLCALWNLVHASGVSTTFNIFDLLAPRLEALGKMIDGLIGPIGALVSDAVTNAITAGLSDFDFNKIISDALSPTNDLITGINDPEDPDSVISKILAMQSNLGGLIEGGSVTMAEALSTVTKNFIPDLVSSFDSTQLETAKDKIVQTLGKVSVPDPELDLKISTLRESFKSSPEDFTDALIALSESVVMPAVTLTEETRTIGEPMTESEAISLRDKLASLWMVIFQVTSALDIIIEVATAGQVEWMGRTMLNIVWTFAPSNVLKDMMYGDYDAAAKPIIARIRRRSYRPHRLQIQEAAALYARGNLSRQAAEEMIANAGVPDELIPGLLELELSYPTESEVHKLFYRNLINDSEYTQLLQKSKLPVELTETMKQAQRPIPGASDLVRFTVREDLGEAWLAEQLAKHGYAPEWAAHYWASHWELPSVRQAYELWARDLIDFDTLDNLLIMLDLHPMFRAQLRKARFKLIPRVDLRRAFAAGVLTFDELEARYGKLGYSPEDARLEAVLQTRETFNAEINSLRSSATADFKEGYITESQLRADLDALGFSDDEVNLSIQDAIRQRQNDLNDDQLAILRELFRKGKIDEAIYRSELSLIVSDTERVNQIVEFELARRSISKPTVVSGVSVSKIKTDLVNDFVDGYIDRSTLEAHLSNINLTQAEIDVEVLNAELRYENRFNDALVKFYTTAFREDKIDETVFREALAKVIVRPEKISVLVEHEKAKKDFPI